MEISGKFFKISDHIDFKIIAFEGRRKCSFILNPIGSADFDFHWREKLEL